MYKDKDSERAGARRAYRKYRNKVIVLLGEKCVSCGIEDRDVLQIDHIVPIKKMARERPANNRFFHMIINGSFEKAELQLLCANCHMKKSVTEF